MAYYNDTASTASFGTSRIAAYFSDLALRVRRYKLYRETFNGLDALTARDLADLGLTRGELRRVAWDAAKAAA